MPNAKRYWADRDKWLAQSKEYQRTHKRDIRERERHNYKKYRDKILARKKRYYQEHREELLAKNRQYQQQNKHKTRTYAKTHYYNVPLDKECASCGTTESLERHHPDYSKPLEIVTLCHSCHMRLHHKLRVTSVTGRRETHNIRNNETSRMGFEPKIGFALKRPLCREGETDSKCLNPLLGVSRMFPTLGSGLSQRGMLGPLSEYKGEEGDRTPDRNGNELSLRVIL